MEHAMPETRLHTENDEDRNRDGARDPIPPPEAFAADSPEAIADSFEEDMRKQLNLLRERTFNPELRNLVDRIRENEPLADGDALRVGEIESLTDEQLELELYRLFYRARSIRENGEINIAFNPFDLRGDSEDVSIQYSLASYIVERMRSLSFSPFALLSYNISLKAFSPTVHTLDRYSVENISISLRDELFREISSRPEGLIIDEERIHYDPFLAKLFSQNTGEAPRPVYFNMLSCITSNLVNELPIEGSGSVSPFLPSAILMIELDEQTAGSDPAEITAVVRQNLSLPFFILNDYQSLVFSAQSYEDLEYVYNVLDYLFTVFLLRKDRSGIILRSSIKESPNMPFLIKYIISKLSHRLLSDSAIVHIIKDRLIIMTHNDMVEQIQSLICDYNRLFNDQFTIIEFKSKDFEDSVDIIQKFILTS